MFKFPLGLLGQFLLLLCQTVGRFGRVLRLLFVLRRFFSRELVGKVLQCGGGILLSLRVVGGIDRIRGLLQRVLGLLLGFLGVRTRSHVLDFIQFLGGLLAGLAG